MPVVKPKRGKLIKAGTVFRALCVRQNHANNIGFKLKGIETRIWETHYRGDLLIVSSARPEVFPWGSAICAVRIVDCRPMTRADERRAMVSFKPGLFAWDLDDIRPLTPFKVPGQLKFFPVTIPAGIRWVEDFATVLPPELFGTVARHDEHSYGAGPVPP